MVFSSLWNAIKSFIDPKTRNKITFLSLKKKAKVQQAFTKIFDEETIQWLLNEMEENRQGGEFAQGKKVYDHAALEKLGGSNAGDTPVAEDGSEKEEKPRHCHLGTPAFLRELRAWKGPLPPQLTYNKFEPDTLE